MRFIDLFAGLGGFHVALRQLGHTCVFASELGETLKALQRRLKAAGYMTDFAYLSPHQFGIPQIREHIFIVGSSDGLDHFKWPSVEKKAKPALTKILDRAPKDARPIPANQRKC